MATGEYTVRVRGLREVNRALNRTDRDTRTAVLDGLKRAAEPVSRDAQHRLARFQGISLSTIVPRAVGGGVFITQKARKKTGNRGDFGALQMKVGMIPAAEHGEPEFEHRVDEALGRLIAREGF